MEMKIPQQVRAASGDPRRGAIPVELIRSQSFDEFPCIFTQKAGVSGTNRLDLGKEGSRRKDQKQSLRMKQEKIGNPADT